MTFISIEEIQQIAVNSAESVVTTVADIVARDALVVKEGDFAFVTSESAWYVHDGSTWLLVVDQDAAPQAHTHVSADITDADTANGVALLDGTGKIKTSQIPPLAISETYVVADIPARDALTVQEGDVAIVTGESKTYIWDGSAWQQVLAPASGGDMVAATYDPTAVGGDAFDADNHAYSNATSGLTATNTQAAIDEIDSRIDSLETDSHTHANLASLDLVSGTNTGDEVQATESVSGIGEVATQVETNAGTLDTHFITPLKLANYNGFAAATHNHVAADVTDFDTEVSNNTDVAANTGARHDALTLGGVANDTTDDTLDLTGQSLTVNLAVAGVSDGAMSAADKSKLDGISGTNTGDEVQATESVLGIAEIATQAETNTGTDDLKIVTPAKLSSYTGFAAATHTHTASDVTDFDTEVSNNTSVSANTSKVSADGSIDTHSDVDTTTAAPSTGQVLEWDGFNWVPATPSAGGLTTKSGKILPGAFTGNPKVATVAFSTAFPDVNYSIAFGVESSSNTTWSPAVVDSTKATTGFSVQMGSNSISNLTCLNWIAVAHGES